MLVRPKSPFAKEGHLIDLKLVVIGIGVDFQVEAPSWLSGVSYVNFL
jgi:hypothetical protein